MSDYRSGFGYQWRVDRASLVSLTTTGLIVALSLVTLTPAPSLGEDCDREGRHFRGVLEGIAGPLSLTGVQQAAVTPILEDEINQRQALLDKLRLEMARLDQETVARLAGVLSTEQLVQYDKMLAGYQPRVGEKQLPSPGQEDVPPYLPGDGGQSQLYQ